MPLTQADPIQAMPNTPVQECYRALYVRRVPEQVWILVHDNAIRSRMRLQDYIVKILEGCEPFPR
jgi:hypothetical protein